MWVSSKDGKDRMCNWSNIELMSQLSTLVPREFCLPIAQSISITTVPLDATITQSGSIIRVCPYIHQVSVLCRAECRWFWENDFPAPAITILRIPTLYDGSTIEPVATKQNASTCAATPAGKKQCTTVQALTRMATSMIPEQPPDPTLTGSLTTRAVYHSL